MAYEVITTPSGKKKLINTDWSAEVLAFAESLEAENAELYWKHIDAIDVLYKTTSAGASITAVTFDEEEMTLTLTKSDNTTVSGDLSALDSKYVAQESGKSLMSDAEHTKLAGVANNATANSTDAQLRDRSTHTGMQAISTVTGLQGVLDGKLDAADYNDRFKGKYTSLSALQAAHPTASIGDYAQVDPGPGTPVVNYNWDAQDGWVEGGSTPSATNTDELPEGSSNLYFTTARAQTVANSAVASHVANANPHTQYLQIANYSKSISFSSTVPFDAPVNNMADHTITGSISFSPNTTNAADGYCAVVRLIGSGAGSVDFTTFKKLNGSDAVSTVSGLVSVVFFMRIAGQYYYTVKLESRDPVTVNVVFDAATHISASSTTWTSSGGNSAYGNTGLDTTHLFQGNSILYFKGTSVAAVLGLYDSAAQVEYASMKVGIVIGGDGNIYKVEGGSLSSSIKAINSSNWYGIRRSGNAFDVVESSNESTWSSISVFSYSNSADMSNVADISGSGLGGSMVAPKMTTP